VLRDLEDVELLLRQSADLILESTDAPEQLADQLLARLGGDSSS
jgi:hypothetical protein